MSISAKSISFFLKISHAKKLVEKSFENPVRSKKPIITERLRQVFNASDFRVMSKTVVTIAPKEITDNIHIIYFHGGAYVLEGSTMHWKLIEQVATNASCKVSYIDYPLAPENTYRNTFEMVQHSFDKLTKLYPNDRFMFMGDSAGGGLALAFAQKLVKEKSIIRPQKIILFSPWLDLAMQHPDIKQQEGFDQLLPLQGLIEAGKKYAGDDDPSQPLLSPINGSLDGLGATAVFYGTHELFYPDCQKLEQIAKTTNAGFVFHEFPEMQHDWVIYPIPEATQTIEMAIEFILS